MKNFSFQLRITGLNILAVQEGKDCGMPQRADLFVIRTHGFGHHQHVPRLICDPDTISNAAFLQGTNHELIPTVDGRLGFVMPLSGFSLDLRVSNPGGRKLEIPGEEPADRTRVDGNGDSFYWLPDLESMGIDGLDPNILRLGVTHPAIAAHVRLPYGALSSEGIAVRFSGNVRQKILWEYLDESGAGAAVGQTLLTNFAVLTIESIDDFVQITEMPSSPIASINIQLENVRQQEPVVASIVNLPPRLPPNKSQSLSHFTILGSLSMQSISDSKVKVPTVAGLASTPDSDICPTARWHYQ